MTLNRPAKTAGDLELVLVLEDEPAEAAGARCDAEHQLGRDQGAPGEGPTDLEAGEDAGEGGGHEDGERRSGQPLQAVVAADHAERRGHAEEARRAC